MNATDKATRDSCHPSKYTLHRDCMCFRTPTTGQLLLKCNYTIFFHQGDYNQKTSFSELFNIDAKYLLTILHIVELVYNK